MKCNGIFAGVELHWFESRCFMGLWVFYEFYFFIPYHLI